jgi:hypothetical protein
MDRVYGNEYILISQTKPFFCLLVLKWRLQFSSLYHSQIVGLDVKHWPQFFLALATTGPWKILSMKKYMNLVSKHSTLYRSQLQI